MPRCSNYIQHKLLRGRPQSWHLDRMALLPLLQGPEDYCDFTSKTLKVIRNIAAQNVKVAFHVPSQKGPSIGISSQKYLHTKIPLSGGFERELGTEYGGGWGIGAVHIWRQPKMEGSRPPLPPLSEKIRNRLIPPPPLVRNKILMY